MSLLRASTIPLLCRQARRYSCSGSTSGALPAAGSAPEVEPLQEYLRACRHSSGIVLARNSDMVMMNDYARQVLDPGDQVVLLGQAAEALAARRSGAVAVELPRALGADLLPARARRWPLRRRCAREA